MLRLNRVSLSIKHLGLFLMYEILDKINQIDDAIEADPLHSVRILDWILFTVCSNEIKKFERL
jgi:hypothetical protein